MTNPDIIAGKNPVTEALRAGRPIEKLFIAEAAGRSMDRLRALARENGVIVQAAGKSKLDELAPGVAHQGVVALASAHAYATVEDILARAQAAGEPPFLILLDEVTDPQNLGSVIRSANAAGAHGVIIPKRRSAGLTGTVAKVSAGAVEYTPVARVSNLTDTMKRLKEKNIWFVGAHQDADACYTDADLSGGIGIVIGSEGEGLGRLVKETCDFLVGIPMKGEISSLNAAVAGGLLLYEVVRQRGLKK